MSFEAVNWAWSQRQLQPNHRLVLLALANRHNPDFGCFPSIGKIVEDVNCSRSTVLRSLAALEECGLVRIESHSRENGSQTSNRYYLQFEEGVSQRHPPSVTETLPPVSERHPHKQVINKQVSLNLSLQQMDERLDKSKAVLAEGVFEVIWKLYPKKVGKGAAKAAWMKACKKLAVYELEDKIEAYVRSIEGKELRYIPHLATWLNQERWEDELQQPDFGSMTTAQQMDHILGGVFSGKVQGQIGNE